jgi:hypothetical protein
LATYFSCRVSPATWPDPGRCVVTCQLTGRIRTMAAASARRAAAPGFDSTISQIPGSSRILPLRCATLWQKALTAPDSFTVRRDKVCALVNFKGVCNPADRVILRPFVYALQAALISLPARPRGPAKPKSGGPVRLSENERCRVIAPWLSDL